MPVHACIASDNYYIREKVLNSSQLFVWPVYIAGNALKGFFNINWKLTDSYSKHPSSRVYWTDMSELKRDKVGATPFLDFNYVPDLTYVITTGDKLKNN